MSDYTLYVWGNSIYLDSFDCLTEWIVRRAFKSRYLTKNMRSNPSTTDPPNPANTSPIGEEKESLDKILDSCSVEALKMVLLILRARQNNAGRGT